MADVSLLFNILAKDNTAGGINSASSRMDRFKARVSLAAVGILGAAAVMGKKAVEIASDTAESTSKVQTLLGSSSKAAMDFANTSATAFGMSKTEALASVGAMAAVQVAMGSSKAEASKLSVEYTKLSADLGSFNNASSSEVQEALTASLSGEYEMLKKYGIVVNDSTLAIEAQRIGMKKHGATWDSAQKKQLSYNIIMASTKAAQGDFARTSGGLANQTKIMSARVEDLQGKIGAKLLPAVVKIAGKFNELLDWVDKNQAKAKILAGVIGGLAGVIVGAAVVLKAFAAAQMVARAASLTWTAAMWLLNAAVLANPIVGITAAVAALVVGIVICYKKFDTFRYIVNMAIKLVANVFITYVDTVLGGIEGMLRAASHLPKWLGGGAFDSAANAVAGIRAGLQRMKDSVNALPTSKAQDFNRAIRDISRSLAAIPKVTNVRIDVQTRNTVAGASSAGQALAGGRTRAAGGPVARGETYLVGERGPEVVTMAGDGYVTPNGGMRTVGGRGGGGGTMTVRHEHVFRVEGDSNDPFVQWLRKQVRTLGRGDVQKAFGVKGANT